MRRSMPSESAVPVNEAAREGSSAPAFSRSTVGCAMSNTSGDPSAQQPPTSLAAQEQLQAKA